MWVDENKMCHSLAEYAMPVGLCGMYHVIVEMCQLVEILLNHLYHNICITGQKLAG